jgi:hypothetical protein
VGLVRKLWFTPAHWILRNLGYSSKTAHDVHVRSFVPKLTARPKEPDTAVGRRPYGPHALAGFAWDMTSPLAKFLT